MVIYVLVTPVVVTATPTAVPPLTVSATPNQYPTHNGYKSQDDLQRELTAAGYTGPWDTASLLAAYDRATAPTATPLPTATPVPTASRPVLDPALAAECARFAFDFTAQVASYGMSGTAAGPFMQSVQNECNQSAINLGAFGVQCWEFANTRYMQANLNLSNGPPSTDLLFALYHSCTGGR